MSISNGLPNSKDLARNLNQLTRLAHTQGFAAVAARHATLQAGAGADDRSPAAVIGKVISGGSFGATVGYVMKEQSRVLEARGVEPPGAREMVEDFEDQARLNPRPAAERRTYLPVVFVGGCPEAHR